MISKLLIAWAVMAACVVIHAAGITSAVRWLRRRDVSQQSLWGWTWLFILLAGWIILLHVIEITAWALIYAFGRAMPGLQSAWFFSGVT